MPTVRCAIYTRKSSDEGLEQSFNSLDAQREACEAYVLSQAGEGWSALPMHYDDGGYSGGSMERPALQQLMADIARKAVDIVVVYKVDRLTRSLADFARIVELLDAHGASFVSVTQAFNTTTSMGRLTLNVLLSFAQFEREVTGERIRDKIAASKAKGMWMGGTLPLGYDAEKQKLVVNPAEAETVRFIFRRYLELGSVRLLKQDLDRRNIRSKKRILQDGRMIGGCSFSRGSLYHLLSNPAYRGAIRHKDKLYEDAHAAIIDADLWASVQAKLVEQAPNKPNSPKIASLVLLRDLLFDDQGHPMWVVHTVRRGKRYRYYTSSALQAGKLGQPGSLPRIALGVMDAFVLRAVGPILSRGWHADVGQDERVRSALHRVELGEDRVAFDLRREALVANIKPPDGELMINGGRARLTFAIGLKHRNNALVIEAPGAEPGEIDRVLLRTICTTKTWAESLASGEEKTVKALAEQFGYWDHYAANLMPLAWLAPDIVEAIVMGRLAPSANLAALLRQSLPLEWSGQRRLIAELSCEDAGRPLVA